MARTQIDPRIVRLMELAKGYDESRADALRETHADPAATQEDLERKALSEAIRRAILRFKQTQGVTQAEIAARLGVSAAQLTNWVKGHRPIPDAYLLELAAVLGVDFRRELIGHFRALTDAQPSEDLELVQLVSNLNREAKQPLLRLLKRLQSG